VTITTNLQRLRSQGRALVQRFKPQSASVRNVLKLAGGTAGSQVITVAAAPILTRLYGPESFGVLATFASILALLNVVSSLSFELAIAVPEDEEEAIDLVWLCFALVSISTAVTVLVVMLAQEQLLGWFQQPNLRSFLWLLPFGVFFIGIYNSLNYWAIRRKQFTLLAKSKFRQGIAGAIISILAAPLGVIGLLLGQMSSQFLGFPSILLENKSVFLTHKTKAVLANTNGNHLDIGGRVRTRYFTTFCLGINLKSLTHKFQRFKMISKKYSDFASYGTFSCLLNACALQLPILILGIHYHDKELGMLAVSQKILLTPISLIASSLSQFLLSEAASQYRSDKIYAYTLRIAMKLGLVGIFLVVIILLSSPLLWFILGARWSEIPKLIPLLTPMLFGQIVVSPLSTLMTGASKNKESVAGQICYFIFRVIPLLLVCNYVDFDQAVLIFSVSTCAGYFLYFLNMLRVFRLSI